MQPGTSTWKQIRLLGVRWGRKEEKVPNLLELLQADVELQGIPRCYFSRLNFQGILKSHLPRLGIELFHLRSYQIGLKSFNF